MIYWPILPVALLAMSCASQHKPPVGLSSGKLPPCSGRPNCVCSEDTGGRSWIEPLTFKATPEEAWECLKRAVHNIGGNIEKEDGGYLWATFKTQVLRFVDDVEFRMDAANQVIHVRSASRVGYSDFGVNRRRVERLRSGFVQLCG